MGRAISLDDVCFLLSYITKKGELSQNDKTPVPRQVFCARGSINRYEYSLTAKDGLKASHVIIVNKGDYNNEKRLEYNGDLYHIYRTFQIDDEHIELYCEVKIGGK